MAMVQAMQIEVEALGPEGRSFQHTYSAEELAFEDESVRVAAPIEARGRAIPRDSGLRVAGDLVGTVAVDCDRCLKPVNVALSVHFDVGFLADTEYEASVAHELGADDLDVAPYSGGVVDLDELVREQILLALPSRSLCSESCKGLCPICGRDRNANPSCNCEAGDGDPRWAALRSLK